MFRLIVLVSVIAVSLSAPGGNIAWYCNLLADEYCEDHMYEPRCGTNGVTYRNMCDIGKAHCLNDAIDQAHRGPCNYTAPSQQEVDQGSQAILDQQCAALSHVTCQFKDNEKICGTDGNTYETFCEYEKARNSLIKTPARMRLLVAYFGVLFACGLISQTTCMTNREFVDMMKDSAEDVKESSLGDDDYDNKDDDAIELPGGPDDELNLDYLMVQSGLPEMMMSQLASLSKSESKSGDLGCHHHHHHHHHHHWHHHHHYIAGCRCHAKSCQCCRHVRFSVLFWHKRLTFRLKSCARVTYRSYNTVYLRFIMNHHTVFHHAISIIRPPHSCYGLSKSSFYARVCMQFYHVNVHYRSFCLRVHGYVKLGCKRFNVNMHLGCYRVYAMGEDKFRSLLDDSESLMTYINSGDPSIETSDYFNLTETHSLLDLVKHAEITEIANHDESMEPADIKETAEDDDAMETP